MEFERRDAPFVTPSTDVASIMRQVLYALIPAALAYVWYFGSGFIFNLIVAGIFCVAGEAAMLRLRGKPVESTLLDYSALVTAALLAFAMPAQSLVHMSCCKQSAHTNAPMLLGMGASR